MARRAFCSTIRLPIPHPYPIVPITQTPPREAIGMLLPYQCLKASISKLFHVSLPYSSSRVTFPSAFHQSTEMLIMPALSPFLIPGGRLGLASSGGSTARVNHTTCSMIENFPGSALPSMEIAWTLRSFKREVNPLFCSYQSDLGDLTIARAIEE